MFGLLFVKNQEQNLKFFDETVVVLAGLESWKIVAILKVQVANRCFQINASRGTNAEMFVLLLNDSYSFLLQ